MSLEKFISIIGIDNYQPNENEILNMLPKALQRIYFKIAPWNADIVQNMLILHYGLNGNNEHTLQQIGKIYGRSGECIRWIEIKAFRYIRRYLQNN